MGMLRGLLKTVRWEEAKIKYLVYRCAICSMGEPSAKMLKMGEQKSTNQAEDFFDPNVQDFAKVRLKPTFVDHTQLIELFFGGNRKKLYVKAPPHFCKSTNLSMLKLFYEIKSDGTVEPNVEDRHMFHVFRDTNIMKIETDKHREALKKHFCAHPVLHVDLSVSQLASYDDVMRHVLEAIRKAYKYHEPSLLTMLKDNSKYYFESKLKAITSGEIMPESLINHALSSLCSLLYKAYGGKRVLVLIDAPDAVITAALACNLDEKQIEHVGGVMTNLLSMMTKGNHIEREVQGVLLTGISYFKTCTYSDAVKATSHSILSNKYQYRGDRMIVEMYGLTQDQLDNLLEKLVMKNLLKRESLESIKKTIEENYNGYYTSSNTMRIYSLWSVLHYLRSSKTVPIHAKIAPIAKYYREVFQDDVFGGRIIQLLAGETVHISYEEVINISHLVGLQSSKPKFTHDIDILFSLLMDVGLLTNAEKKPPAKNDIKLDRLMVTLPNKEMKSVLKAMITDYGIQIGSLDLALQQECANEIDYLAEADDSGVDTLLFKQHLKSLFDKLTELCQQLSQSLMWIGSCKESYLKVLIWMIMRYTQFKEMQTESFDVWVKDEMITCIWEMKINEEQAENKTSMWAMKEICGDQDTQKEGYMQTARKTARFLLLGLSVDGEMRPSISVLTKGKDKGIFASKTEHTSRNFAVHYHGWYDLLKADVVKDNTEN